jgi:outer membrane murein-binding lipoprotein Lpp
MDTKANLSNRRKINDLAIQHNKLTTLVACLLNEVNALKRELQESRGGESHGRSNDNSHNGRTQSNSNKFSNFNDLKAEDILKQLSINTVDN